MARPQLIVRMSRRYLALVAAELALGATAAGVLLSGLAEVSGWCGADPDFCRRVQTGIYFAVAVGLLVAAPLGLAGLIGYIRRGGIALIADPVELRYGCAGRLEGPLAWHRIKTIRMDRGPLGPRIGIDLVQPERVVQDFGRPLGPVEDWRMKRGGPTLTVSGFSLEDPLEDIYQQLCSYWKPGQ